MVLTAVILLALCLVVLWGIYKGLESMYRQDMATKECLEEIRDTMREIERSVGVIEIEAQCRSGEGRD